MGSQKEDSEQTDHLSLLKYCLAVSPLGILILHMGDLSS